MTSSKPTYNEKKVGVEFNASPITEALVEEAMRLKKLFWLEYAGLKAYAI
jgi:hypothetical protein